MFATEADRPGIFISFRRSSWLIEPNSVLTFTLYLSPMYFTPNSKGLLLTPDPYSPLYIRYSTTDPWSDNICIIILCFIFFLFHSTMNRGRVGTAGDGEKQVQTWVLPLTTFFVGLRISNHCLCHTTLPFYHRSNTNHTVWYLNTFGAHTQREQWLFFLLP